MKFFGDVDLQQNLLKNTVLESLNGFPASPKAGQIVFSNKKLHFCAEIITGFPSWIPLTGEIDAYAHTQSTQATQWTIVHGLGSSDVVVQLYDGNGFTIFPDSIDVSSSSQVVVGFNSAQVGKAIIIKIAGQASEAPGGGDAGGGTEGVYNFELSSAEPSTNPDFVF